MNSGIKTQFDNFIKGEKDYPLLAGFVSGFYPMFFYYSNNYESINSYQHFLFFSFLFLLVPTVTTYVFYKVFNSFEKWKPYKKHVLFILMIEIMCVFLSQVYYLTIKKKVLFALLIILCLLSLKGYKHYKKVLLFIVFLSVIPFFKCGYIIIYKNLTNTTSWMNQADAIESIKFKKKPNIYFIEPDGYSGEEVMSLPPYNYKNVLYDWLKEKSFVVYTNTRSNYPITLVSNASMFSMKHHYFGNNLFGEYEVENSRNIIVGNNPVISILKNNNYKTFFITEVSYFQQNWTKQNYDFYNISNSEIPFFDNGFIIHKDVSSDFKKCLRINENNKQPKFYFIQKLTPGHIHFDGTGKKAERNLYLKHIEQANIWIKEMVDLINKKDPHAIILIASDHGGFVGLVSDPQMFVEKDKSLIKSIYSNLIAIKWNDEMHNQYDEKLKTNVNIFRILFSYLSEDKSLLDNLENDGSYNINHDNYFRKPVVKVLE
ncbi:hypothetical protein [Flavobacterium sp. LM4]|uniref:hypothetical protein n=1 Tax=Flavobacterium sp. LM4 TaxID=1938609 RepID=UPI0009927C48|nr:hypothetical protein [Flavobacterium sp. LM4]OOV13052.1 hypothetical protein BXU10_23705 [Flavobacterium sp. LM4]